MTPWLGLLLACRTPPRVVPIDFVIAEDDRGSWEQLAERSVAGLQHDLSRRRLVEVTVQGRTASDDQLADLPPDVAVAAYTTSSRPVPVQHIDLCIEAEPALYRPVTVRIDERVLRIDYGEPLPREGSDVEATETEREAVVRRFGLGALDDGSATWTRREVELVDQALAVVEPEVLALLRGMPLVRDAVSTRAPGRELAWFDPRTEPPTISIYDLAFAPASGAVGPIDAMRPLAVMTVVHELGHVLADAPLRAAWLRAAADPSDRAARQELRSLGRSGAVIRAWRDVRDHRAPTPYGARGAHESFAEAYALHLLDPEALQEVMPAAAAWFASGEHLAAAGIRRKSPTRDPKR